jgi:hypothetical protein
VWAVGRARRRRRGQPARGRRGVEGAQGAQPRVGVQRRRRRRRREGVRRLRGRRRGRQAIVSSGQRARQGRDKAGHSERAKAEYSVAADRCRGWSRFVMTSTESLSEVHCHRVPLGGSEPPNHGLLGAHLSSVYHARAVFTCTAYGQHSNAYIACSSWHLSSLSTATLVARHPTVEARTSFRR